MEKQLVDLVRICLNKAVFKSWGGDYWEQCQGSLIEQNLQKNMNRRAD